MSKLVVASYCTTFLKSEMLHIYRQVTALRDVSTFVMTKKMQNTERFRSMTSSSFRRRISTLSGMAG